MTVCTSASVSRAADVSIRNNDSGVVMRMSGGRLINSRRRPGGVSPERTPTLMLGAGTPRRSAMRVIPVSGVRRLRSTSTASAFSGETYSTRVPAVGGRGSPSASRSIAQRNAASVLPEPGRGDDQRVVAIGDRRPRLGLSRGRLSEGAGEPLAGQRAEPGEGIGCGRAHLAIVPSGTDNFQRRAAATASASSAGMLGTRATASNSACAQASATWSASMDGSMTRCRHSSKVKASQP